jgi:small-conductance mechanosensitive channel
MGAMAAARQVDGVIQQGGRKPAVWLIEYGDSSVNYELVVGVEPRLALMPNAAHAELMWALDSALKEAGIEIPFPQRDLHLRSGELALRLLPAKNDDREPD